MTDNIRYLFIAPGLAFLNLLCLGWEIVSPSPDPFRSMIFILGNIFLLGLNSHLCYSHYKKIRNNNDSI